MIVNSYPLTEAWNQLAQLAEETDQPIYSYPEFIRYLSIVSDGPATVILANDGSRTVGALGYVEKSQPGIGRVINSLPWYGSHGSCVLDPTRRDANEIRRMLLKRYAETASEPDVLSATMILLHGEEAIFDLYAEILAPRVTDSRIGQITQLPAAPGDEDASLLELFTQKTRNLTRKSLKQGFREVVTDNGDAWEYLQRIHRENISALGGKAKPRSHFEALRTTLPPDMRRLSLAMDGDHPVAALLLLYGGGTVEYLTPAIEVSARSRQPMSFLILHGMRDAIARGCNRWNWGGTWSGQSSLHHFKAGFGAQDATYSYLINASAKGFETLRKHRDQLGELYPYLYTYPYEALDEPV